MLRAPRPGEAAALTALCMLSKQSNGYDAAFMAACVAELTVTETDLRERLFQVIDDGDLRAVAAIDPVADGRGEVSLFFVHPDCQGQGLGRRLMGWVFGTAAGLGWARLELDADPKAEPFYKAMGFETVGRRASGSIPDRSLPHMEWRRNGAV